MKQKTKKPYAREKQKQQILSNVSQDTQHEHQEQYNMRVSEPVKELSEEALRAQWNLTSRNPSETELTKAVKK